MIVRYDVVSRPTDREAESAFRALLFRPFSMTKNRTLLLDNELIDMLVVLRMNKDFMVLARKRVENILLNIVDD